ncbi:hypothetical protein FZEAL_10992, partial [Fusarium zealandicum]
DKVHLKGFWFIAVAKVLQTLDVGPSCPDKQRPPTAALGPSGRHRAPVQSAFCSGAADGGGQRRRDDELSPTALIRGGQPNASRSAEPTQHQ